MAVKKFEVSFRLFEDDFQQINAESFPENLVSILTAPELLHTVNATQKVNMISHLQQRYGNAYIQKAIQPKLKIGQPRDKYEQEADRVAEAILRMPGPPVQRQPEKAGEEELIQTKPVAEQITPFVQR